MANASYCVCAGMFLFVTVTGWAIEWSCKSVTAVVSKWSTGRGRSVATQLRCFIGVAVMHE